MKVTGEMHRRDSVPNYLGTHKREVCGTNYIAPPLSLALKER